MKEPRVTRVNPRNLVRSPEVEIGNKLVDAMDRSSFNPRVLAFVISQSPIAVQKKFMALIEAMIDYWAEILDAGLVESPEHESLLIRAMRVKEFLNKFK